MNLALYGALINRQLFPFAVCLQHTAFMYRTTHGRRAFISSWLLFFMWWRVFYTRVSCVSKRYWISVRYVGLTDSSVTRVRVFRHVRKIAKSVYWLRHDCLSVRPPAWNIRLPLGGFPWSLIFEHFSKICRENPSFIKIGQGKQVLYVKTNRYFLIISRWIFLRMRNISDKSCREDRNKLFMFNSFPPPTPPPNIVPFTR